jgi:cytidylate kinase
VSPAAPSVVVTIDGPAGSGKSSAAEALAGRLGWQVLDTGAMYRAAGVLALERGVDPSNGPAVAAALRQSVIDFDWSSSPPEIRLDGRPIGEAIRSPAATAAASAVAPHPEVRACLVESQRRIAAEHPRLVSEGRDQGSLVFPDALVRFYLDAPVEERARRRVRQWEAEGRIVELADVEQAIRERDRLDEHREVGPLRRPEAGVELETGSLDLEQVVDRLESTVREAMAEHRIVAEA